ncbi:hypothetical protein [Amycolatopsis sp. NPDC051372]
MITTSSEIAVPLTLVPTWLIASASQKCRKSRCRNSPPIFCFATLGTE